jgi:plasmid maintenance system killer protein
LRIIRREGKIGGDDRHFKCSCAIRPVVARKFLSRAGAAIAKATHGVIFDPQTDQVTLPSGIKQVAATSAFENASVISFPRSNQLEAFKGDRKGEYSVRINKQWRICFRWRGCHALDVEIADYH